MEIIKVHQTKNRCYQQGRKVKHVGILVHSTGATNKNLKRYVDAPDRLGVNTNKNTWNSSASDKAVHAFIGYDKDKQIIVAECLPLDISCWGSGSGVNGGCNRTHIQFEICQGSDTDAEYYQAAIAVAEEYCAYLCQLKGWTAADIISHKEAAEAGKASNHGDPDSWMKKFGDSMDKFRARVQARLNGENPAQDAPTIKVEEVPDEEKKEATEPKETATAATAEGKTVTIELNTQKNGFKGEQVKTIQRLLSALGHDLGKVDGVFGSKTLAAVKAFQKAEKLDADGIVGKKTWNALLK